MDGNLVIFILLAACAVATCGLLGFKLPRAPRLDGYANEWARKRGVRKCD